MIDSEFGKPNMQDIDSRINARAMSSATTETSRYRGPKPVFKDDEFTFDETIQAEAWRAAVARDRAVGRLPERHTGEISRAEGLNELVARFGNRAAIQETVAQPQTAAVENTVFEA